MGLYPSTITAAFSSNVEENDIIAVFHEAVYNMILLGGDTVTVGTATQNWNAAEANIVQIGTNDTPNELGSVEVSLHNLVGNVTLRMYKQINGTERQFFEQIWVAAAMPVGVVLINSTWKINEVLRITAESDAAADDGQAIDYEYIIRALT